MESIVINGVDPLHRIFVGTQVENVWINLTVPGGNAYMRHYSPPMISRRLSIASSGVAP